MLTLAKKPKLIDAITKKFHAMTTDKDLAKEGLTLSDHYGVLWCLRDIKCMEHATTVQTSVASWFRKNGATVEVEDVGWRITV